MGNSSNSDERKDERPPGDEQLQKVKLENSTIKEMIAEFAGTFILIIYGNGATAATVLDGKGVPDAFGATWAWGVGIILGITVCGAISGGHINPAVTLAFGTVGKCPLKKVPLYIIAQHLGGLLASAVLYFTYYDAIKEFDPDKSVNSSMIFTTIPRDGISIWNCFFGELVGGALVMFAIMAITDKKNLNIPQYLYPLFIGFSIQVTLQVFGLNCMAPINPARDFATRVFTAIAGWGGKAFEVRGYGYFWIGLVGPHLGFIIGAWLYYLCVGLHLTDDRQDDSEPEIIKTGA